MDHSLAQRVQSRLSLLVIIALCCQLGAVGSATAADQKPGQFSARSRAVLTELRESQPNVQLSSQFGRIDCVYGVAMEHGSTPEESSEKFVQKYAGLFGTTVDQLALKSNLPDAQHSQPIMYNQQTGEYKFTQLYYCQYVDNIPVFRSELRLLVRNENDNPLVMAKSTLHDLTGFVGAGAQKMSTQTLSSSVQIDNPNLDKYTESETVIWAGTEGQWVEPRTATKVIASNDFPEMWLYLIDAETGEVLYKEDLIIFEDVSGNVHGNSTDGGGAAICDPAIPTPLPYGRVQIGATSVYTDSLGAYSADVSIPGTIEVESYLDGVHFTVINEAGEEAVLSQTTSGGGDIDFLHNASSTDPAYLTQVNAYVEANRVRDFVLRYNPSYPGVATNLCQEINVNHSGGYCPCNAWYVAANPPFLTFCVGSSACANTAFSSVIYHEYGHHLCSNVRQRTGTVRRRDVRRDFHVVAG